MRRRTARRTARRQASGRPPDDRPDGLAGARPCERRARVSQPGLRRRRYARALRDEYPAEPARPRVGPGRRRAASEHGAAGAGDPSAVDRADAAAGAPGGAVQDPAAWRPPGRERGNAAGLLDAGERRYPRSGAGRASQDQALCAEEGGVKRAIRTYWAPVGVIVAFAMLSTFLGVYILGQQRLQSPFAARYDVRVEFAATPGLAPGLGQPADVAGVPVGEISAASVHDGRALVTLTIERSQLPHVYANGSAALVPQTPLDNLAVYLNPGS